MIDDLRFEHIRSKGDAAWMFFANAWADPESDQVSVFFARYEIEPSNSTCYIPIEHLKVVSPVQLGALRLLPLDDSSLPEEKGYFVLTPPVGSVLAVPVFGTDGPLMADRAKAEAAHFLRNLRMALGAVHGYALNDRQLRFRMGEQFALDDGASGWVEREDAAYQLELNQETANSLENYPTMSLRLEAESDIDKKLKIALTWIDRASFSGEAIVSLLYLFFALEALLGRKDEGLKANDLAMRQMMLSHAVEGQFTHPSETWVLYDYARSGAVHGEDRESIDSRVVASFATGVRKTVTNFLTLAEREGFLRRSRLLRFLDTHPDRAQMIEWLRENGGDIWTTYLDGLVGQ